jgi:hypothetical protein
MHGYKIITAIRRNFGAYFGPTMGHKTWPPKKSLHHHLRRKKHANRNRTIILNNSIKIKPNGT